MAVSNNSVHLWSTIQSSRAAQRTINPIRKIVDKLQVAPNPDKPVISLGLGDPTVYGYMDTHEVVSKAVSEAALSCRANGYPPASGDEDAKRAIANRYSRPEAPISPQDVIVASGCSGALELAFRALADPGDRILLPRPGFTLYQTICQAENIKATHYPLRPEKNWEIDLQALRSIFQSEGTKIAAWLINNPSNPCGSVYSREHLTDCLALANEFRIPVIADEIYEDMVYGSSSFVPMRCLPSPVPIITVSGLAKRFLVPGWRLGWIILSDHGSNLLDDVRAGIIRLSAVLLGANSIIQKALPTIFENTPQSFYEETNKKLKDNADAIGNILENVLGLTYAKPEGAMYMLLGFDMSSFKGFQDDVSLSELLIEEESVICLPGSIFGIPNYLRIVTCGHKEKLEEACERIKSFCLRHVLKKN